MKIKTFIPNGRCRLAHASWASEVTGLSRNRRDRAPARAVTTAGTLGVLGLAIAMSGLHRAASRKLTSFPETLAV
jgi:hypothetical protein